MTGIEKPQLMTKTNLRRMPQRESEVIVNRTDHFSNVQTTSAPMQSVLHPEIVPMKRLFAHKTNRSFAPKCLFGPPSPGSVERVFEEQQAIAGEQFLQRFGFDVRSGTFPAEQHRAQCIAVLDQREEMNQNEHVIFRSDPLPPPSNEILISNTSSQPSNTATDERPQAPTKRKSTALGYEITDYLKVKRVRCKSTSSESTESQSSD